MRSYSPKNRITIYNFNLAHDLWLGSNSPRDCGDPPLQITWYSSLNLWRGLNITWEEIYVGKCQTGIPTSFIVDGVSRQFDCITSMDTLMPCKCPHIRYIFIFERDGGFLPVSSLSLNICFYTDRHAQQLLYNPLCFGLINLPHVLVGHKWANHNTIKWAGFTQVP